MDVLEQTLEILHSFTPLDAPAMKGLRERCQRLAADGRLELFKTTKKYDGAIGRRIAGLDALLRPIPESSRVHGGLRGTESRPFPLGHKYHP